MNTAIASYIRHALTSLIGLGAWLLAHGLISAADAASVDSAWAQVAGAIAAIVAAVVTRVVILFLAKTNLTGVVTGLTDKVPAWVFVLGMGTLTGLCACASSGCTSAQLTAAESIPIHATAKLTKGTLGYDSATGITVTVDATSQK